MVWLFIPPEVIFTGLIVPFLLKIHSVNASNAVVPIGFTTKGGDDRQYTIHPFPDL